MKDSPEDIAKMDREDAAMERLNAMQLRPFEYVKPGGKKKIKVVRFHRMHELLQKLVRLRFWDQLRDFSDDELASEAQRSADTIRRAICDCVGRGLLKVTWAQEGPVEGQPPMGKRRYEIQWDEVDRASPDFNRDDTGLEWMT